MDSSTERGLMTGRMSRNGFAVVNAPRDDQHAVGFERRSLKNILQKYCVWNMHF
jgi:hypothetical protein